MFIKNAAVTGFQIGHFIQTADGVAKTTGTPTCKRLLDGAGAALTNAASYNSDVGAWEIDLAADDMNADLIGLSFTLPDCLPISYTIRTTTLLVDASGAINSVISTISANVVEIDGETTPVDNLVLALGTGGLVEKLNSALEAAGLAYRFTAEALAEAPTGGSAGSGTGTYTDTIKEGATPLDGVRVQLSTDDVGSNRVYEAYTNALGVFTMNPDPGTYYRWLDLAGYDFAQGVAVVVT